MGLPSILAGKNFPRREVATQTNRLDPDDPWASAEALMPAGTAVVPMTAVEEYVPEQGGQDEEPTQPGANIEHVRIRHEKTMPRIQLNAIAANDEAAKPRNWWRRMLAVFSRT